MGAPGTSRELVSRGCASDEAVLSAAAVAGVTGDAPPSERVVGCAGVGEKAGGGDGSATTGVGAVVDVEYDVRLGGLVPASPQAVTPRSVTAANAWHIQRQPTGGGDTTRRMR
jgi:hypothetical protein